MIPVTVKHGDSVRKLALKTGQKLISELRSNGVKISEACEGNLGCGTCHVFFDDETFKKLPITSDQEEDLLQFSPGLKKTSRLSCAINVDNLLNDAFITIPDINRNVINEDDMLEK